ncbi:MAG TPA: GNAT family N-acetyltransferase [Gaiellaceae bacterium]|nr:GNAT family N-acetyltransferase [Gaiellaceae bacterium]
MAITFRLITREDYPLLLEWHGRPHVERWWTKRTTMDEIEEHYGPTIDGTDPTDHYIALLDGKPLGMVQAYLIADYPDWAEVTGEGEGVAGVDLFIADESNTGRGLGTELLRSFVDDIVFARPATIACIADPDVRNTASLRAFEKAGFRSVREFVDPSDGHVHALVRRDRRS